MADIIWIDAALHKINNPARVQTGEALKGSWTGAVANPEAWRPPIALDWYRVFIQFLLKRQLRGQRTGRPHRL